ncbi:hypothetical protein AB0M46_45635 [Dactylosporangium sp. NPDC051485]|uniref:hypothetical protein n=1 Tax=Dactylosporangium sp. NPDC051485 TaxID=3154846 RepID=UPI00341EE821
MRLIDVDADTATELISAVTAEIPVGASLGRIPVVNATSIMTADDGGAWRVVELRDGRQEITTWRDGREVDRRIVAPDAPHE